MNSLRILLAGKKDKYKHLNIEYWKMKKQLIIYSALFLIFSPNISLSQDYWELVNSPDSVHIFDLAVDPEGRIFLACPYSTGNLTGIFRSDDNCETWQRKVAGMDTSYSPHTNSIAIDDNGILVAGCNGQIYRSIDSGENWTEVYSFGFGYSEAAFGYDSIFLLGSGYQYGIVRSGDNGLTWKPVLNYEDFEPIYEESTTGICFGPDGNIYACSRTFVGGYGSVYISEDLGLTWSVFFNNGYAHFFSIGFDQEGRLLVGSNGLYRYDFQLANWEYLAYNMVPFEMLMVGDSSIYLACDEESGGVGGVVFSNDRGETFEILNSGMEYPDANNFAIDGVGRILVSGTGHRLFRSYDTLITSVEIKEKLINQSLFKYYPNPFKEEIEIISNVDEPSTLTIYNSSGNYIIKSILEPYEVKKISNEVHLAGLYLIEIRVNKQVFAYKIIHL